MSNVPIFETTSLNNISCLVSTIVEKKFSKGEIVYFIHFV